MDKRAAKRWRRENRPNKGANTEAKRRAFNENQRRRLDFMASMNGDDAMLMASMLPLFLKGRA